MLRLPWLLGLLACLLTGCSRTDPHLLTVWSWDIAAQALQARVGDFEASHPGWRVEVLDLGNQAVFERGMAGCAAGGVNLPDVYTVENNKAEVFWSRFPEGFVDLAPLGAGQLRDRFPAFKWTGLEEGSRLYALPWDSGPVVLFYRRDLYAAAGIDPERLETWEDFLQAGQRMLGATGGKVRMLTLGNGQDDDFFRMLANQNEAFYFSADGTQITLNSPGCREALEWIKRLYDAGLVNSGGWTEALEALKSGSVASALYGAWYEGTLRSNLPEQQGQWGVLRMPAQRPGGSRAANIGGSALAIPSSSRKQALAWEFIRSALADTPHQIDMLRDYGLVPSYLPALQDPYVSQPQAFWGGQPIWRLVLDTLPEVKPARGTEFFQEARQIVAAYQADYLEGRYPTAQAALDAAARQLSQATDLPLAP